VILFLKAIEGLHREEAHSTLILLRVAAHAKDKSFKEFQKALHSD